MALTSQQLVVLKTAILAETDPEFVSYRDNGQVPKMAEWYNKPNSPEFTVWKTFVTTAEVGKTVSYIAVEAMTDANRVRITTFYAMNPISFEPRADIRTYWANTFSGALGGEGANTRLALEALWKRAAPRAEKLYATGTGSVASPGTLVFAGSITDSDIQPALAL